MPTREKELSRPHDRLSQDKGEKPKAISGILPAQMLAHLIDEGCILSSLDTLSSQVQPASLDLALGEFAYRVRASFLPGEKKSVQDCIDDFSMHRIDLRDGAVLEVGCVYIVPLMENLSLPDDIRGMANPKSSTGRLNVFTRLIVDGGVEFDRVPAGYHGPLYAEIAPSVFSILMKSGDHLNQLRLLRGDASLGDQDLQVLHKSGSLIGARDGEPSIRGGLGFTVDLTGRRDKGLMGYRAKRHSGVIDISKIGAYNPHDFWEALEATPKHRLILDPNEFYILASRESVKIPPDYAAEMVAYDTQVGEFRVHYAGFFDPGFGWQNSEPLGTRAVLEVRSHEVPFALEHAQPVGRLVYARMAERPSALYGAEIGSSYHRQGLSLSKHFSPWMR